MSKILAHFRTSVQITAEDFVPCLESKVFNEDASLADVIKWGGREGQRGITIQSVETPTDTQFRLKGEDLIVTAPPKEAIVNHIS